MVKIKVMCRIVKMTDLDLRHCIIRTPIIRRVLRNRDLDLRHGIIRITDNP